MKADLARREPEMLAWWEEHRIYEKLRAVAAGRPIHPARRAAVRERRDPHRPRRQQGAEGHHRQVAHARRLRRALCAGLGLPRPADRAPGREDAGQATRSGSTRRRSAMPAASTRPSRWTCSASDFMRLGVMGDWANPYLTLAPRYEAEQLRAFAQIIRNGHLYKGHKPVHWCLDCRSALAEAEVEYEERTSPSIDVRFEVVDRADLARRLGAREPAAGPRQHRHLDHHALDAARQPGGRAASRVRVLAARGRVGRRRGTAGARGRAGAVGA